MTVLMREIQCSSKSHEESKAKANVESWGTFFCNSLNCVPFIKILCLMYRLRDLQRNPFKEKLNSVAFS